MIQKMDFDKGETMRYRALVMPPKFLLAVCSDDRLPVLSFLEQELFLHEGFYFPLRQPGGFSSLAHQEEVPDDFNSVLKQVNFVLTNRPTITMAVVIEHEDCGFRKLHLPNFVGREIEDLPIIADVLLRNFNQLTQIQLYYAVFIGSEVEFTRIRTSVPQPA